MFQVYKSRNNEMSAVTCMDYDAGSYYSVPCYACRITPFEPTTDLGPIRVHGCPKKKLPNFIFQLHNSFTGILRSLQYPSAVTLMIKDATIRQTLRFTTL